MNVQGARQFAVGALRRGESRALVVSPGGSWSHGIATAVVAGLLLIVWAARRGDSPPAAPAPRWRVRRYDHGTPHPPDPAQAPALRASLEQRAAFGVSDLGGGQVDVVPAEGAGATRAFLHAHRLCDANTQITPQLWVPLADHPAYEGNPASRARLLAAAGRLSQIETPAAMLQAIEAAVGGFRNDELPGWLELQLPRLFELFPDGSLWLVSVEPVLSARLTILGGSFALQLTPDFPLDPNNVRGFDALDEHSLTRGVSFGKALDPVLLALSPGAVGYAFDRQPHALVLLFGYDGELREEPPRSLSSLYEPTVFEPFGEEPWDDPAFREDIGSGDIELLF